MINRRSCTITEKAPTRALMIIASASQFHVYLPWGRCPFSIVSNSVLNVKAVVAASFNQEKALVGAFSVIVQLHRLIVYSTNQEPPRRYQIRTQPGIRKHHPLSLHPHCVRYLIWLAFLGKLFKIHKSLSISEKVLLWLGLIGF